MIFLNWNKGAQTCSSITVLVCPWRYVTPGLVWKNSNSLHRAMTSNPFRMNVNVDISAQPHYYCNTAATSLKAQSTRKQQVHMDMIARSPHTFGCMMSLYGFPSGTMSESIYAYLSIYLINYLKCTVYVENLHVRVWRFCVLQTEKKGSDSRAADRCRRKLEACELWLLTHKLSFILELHSPRSKVASCLIHTLIYILHSHQNLHRVATTALNISFCFSFFRVILFTCLLCMSWMNGEKQ